MSTGTKPSHWWRRLLTGPAPETNPTAAQRDYDAWSTLPMFVASITWLVGAAFQYVPVLHPVYGREGALLGAVTWLIFALDFVIRFVIDPSKRTFISRYWPLLVALVFPPLRILLVISAVKRITRDRNSLAKMVGLYAIYSTMLVVIFGALLTLTFEIDAPNANIRSFGDSIWWGFVTVTTVGYGDFTPVTNPGRFVGVLIMFAGAAAVGAVTAAVASRFVSGNRGESSAATGSHPAPTVPTVTFDNAQAGEQATLQALSQQIDQLTKQVAELSERLSPDATRAGSGE